MDNKDLLLALRMNMVLVTVTLAPTADRHPSVPADTAKALANLQRSIKEGFDECSIKFGRRRAIPSSLFNSLVATSGKRLSEMKGLLASLPEDQRGGYGVSMEYEPVPDGAGFGMLPDNFARALAGAVDKRAVNDYEAGFDYALRVLHSRLAFFYKRVTEHNNNVAAETVKRSVVREVVLTDLFPIIELVRAVNITGAHVATATLAALGGIQDYTIDHIRNDTGHRKIALDLVGDALAIIRPYFVTEEDQSDDDTAEAA